MKKAICTFLVWAALIPIGLAGEPVQLESENDRINYSYGYKVGENLKLHALELNPSVLMKGIQDALSETQPLMTQQEMQKTLTDFSKSNVVARQAQKRKMVEKYRGEGREFLVQNAKRPGVVTLPSGLQYKVVREGTGKSPGPTDSVTVHYRGALINGTEFDSSYRKNEPATFRVDGVIAGWTEALQLMKEGAHWQLFIPPDLAYGERGPLRDRTLIFDVELMSVESSE